MNVGDTIVVTAEKLVAGGDALCRVDGMPLFVRSLFPGDRARVTVTEVKKGFARAELDQLIDPGPERRLEPCPISNVCGGCDWTALRLDRQLHWKEKILRETLRRVGKFTEEQQPVIRLHASPLNYRLRSRIHVDQKTGAVGFYALRSHEVVEISDRCEVLGPLAMKHLDEIRAVGREGHWAIALFEDQRDLHIEPIDDDGQRAGIDVELTAARHRFAFNTAGFFQVNRHLLGAMLTRVSQLGSDCRNRRTALDLYGGVGFFSAPLARLFERVTSVESSPASAPYVAKNLPADRVHAVQQPVERFLKRERGTHDLVMLDPPRSGAAPGVMEDIARIAGERVCYLSCDPVTFARDASRLVRHGWRLSTLDLFDLFPNTHHIETLSSFERAT